MFVFVCLGLDRYFKQIAQSARTSNSSEDGAVDDFLGTVNIPLNNLCSNGNDQWYMLENDLNKSRVSGKWQLSLVVIQLDHSSLLLSSFYSLSLSLFFAFLFCSIQGKIRLRLRLTTCEESGSHEVSATEGSDLSRDMLQHETMVRQFIIHELSQPLAKRAKEWTGHLSREAETILHQHAVQLGLSDLQIALCRWAAFVKSHLDFEFSYKLLADKLDSVDRIWISVTPTTREVRIRLD